MSAEVLSARARLGVAARRHDAEAELEARRDLAAAKIAAHAKAVVESAPPLTEAQRDRIHQILHGAPIGGGTR